MGSILSNPLWHYNSIVNSETAIRKRLKLLSDDEIIQVVAVVNQHKLGYGDINELYSLQKYNCRVL